MARLDLPQKREMRPLLALPEPSSLVVAAEYERLTFVTPAQVSAAESENVLRRHHALGLPTTFFQTVEEDRVQMGEIVRSSRTDLIVTAIRGAAPDWRIERSDYDMFDQCIPRLVGEITSASRLDRHPARELTDFGESDPLSDLFEAVHPLSDALNERCEFRYTIVPASWQRVTAAFAGLFFMGCPRFRPEDQSRFERRLLESFFFEAYITISLFGDDQDRLRSRASSLSAVLRGRFALNARFGGYTIDSFAWQGGPLTIAAPWELTPAGVLTTSSELASFIHPASELVMVPGLTHISLPPVRLPSVLIRNTDGVVLGTTSYRGEDVPASLPKSDLHTGHLVIPTGRTGMGKSVAAEAILGQCLTEDEGGVVIDPHGRYAPDTIGRSLPAHRLDDALLWEMGKPASTLGFNLFECPPGVDRDVFTEGVVHSLRQVFEDSWYTSNSMMDRVLDATVRTLVWMPQPGTLLDAPRLFSDSPFRHRATSTVEDPATLQFWAEYEQLSPSEKRRWTQPVLTRLSSFTRARAVRVATCQKHGLNLGQLMDQGKLLFVSLAGPALSSSVPLMTELIVSRIGTELLGRLGEYNKHHRRTYIVCDESSYVLGPTLPRLLNEARKTSVTVILINQHLSRWSQELQDAVLSNVGTLICFRAGVDDARRLAPTFRPFTQEHLENLDRQQALVKMQLHGATMPVFAITTTPLTQEIDESRIDYVRQRTRQLYGRPAQDIEAEINPFTASWTGMDAEVDEEDA